MSSRHAKYLVAAAACALLLAPAGTAHAGGPGPGDPAPPRFDTTRPSPAGNPHSHRAQAAGVCSDARQIGTRGLIRRHGKVIASVKQFYSRACNENYGYLWVWKSFRDSDPRPYDVTVGVYNWDNGMTVGKRSWTGTRHHEFWSHGADTVRNCTSGVGTVRPAGEPYPLKAYSSKRCFR